MEVALRVLIWLYLCVCSLRPLEAFSDLPDGCVPLGSAHGQRGSAADYKPGVSLPAGPYLLSASSQGITVRWATEGNLPDCLTIREASGARACVIGNCSTLTRRHIHAISGLRPLTRYAYAVGRASSKRDWTRIRSGSFTTHPPPGNGTSSLRIWALGDFGTGDSNQKKVLAGALAYMRGGKGPAGPGGKRMPDLGLLLGDNAYSVGSHSEYRRNFFRPYQRVLPHLPIWPVIGNHDSYSFRPSRRPYFDLFGTEAPVDGGAVPSGTAAYYSWCDAHKTYSGNYGAVHFIALDTNHVSYCNLRSRSQHGLKRTPARFDCGAANGSTTFGRGERPGDMLSWLRRDLSVVSADPRVRFLVAYFHHSPFMRGDHNSDNAGREPQSAFARAQLLPLLEEAGVDLVLSGHSHSYQRMCLMDGLYGSDVKLARLDIIRSRGSAEADGAWRRGDLKEARRVTPGGKNKMTAYFAKEQGLNPRSGAVYVVAGSGGKLSGPRGFLKAWGGVQYPPDKAHPASCLSRVELGSLVIDIDGDVLSAAFVNTDGNAPDRWVIDKRGAAARASAAAAAAAPAPQREVTEAGGAERGDSGDDWGDGVEEVGDDGLEPESAAGAGFGDGGGLPPSPARDGAEPAEQSLSSDDTGFVSVWGSETDHELLGKEGPPPAPVGDDGEESPGAGGEGGAAAPPAEAATGSVSEQPQREEAAAAGEEGGGRWVSARILADDPESTDFSSSDDNAGGAGAKMREEQHVLHQQE